MTRTLFFDKNGVAEEIVLQKYNEFDDSRKNHLMWINLVESDKIEKVVPQAIDTSTGFIEDLREEQRPRIANYQTLEDNEDTFTVIVIAVPTKKIFSSDDFQLQMTFIILRNKIYSLSSFPQNVVGEIMAKLLHRNKQYNLTTLFNFILTELLEMGIRVLDHVEDYIDQLEKQIIRSALSNKLLTSLLVLKGRLFNASRLIKADLEPIREIQSGMVPELIAEEVSEQPEDRAKFLLDSIETERENLSNIINLQLAIASNTMNKQFYWLAIIGSILVIPTIISSIWGMNVPVPQINFWTLILLMFLLTILSAILVKFLMPKQNLM